MQNLKLYSAFIDFTAFLLSVRKFSPKLIAFFSPAQKKTFKL